MYTVIQKKLNLNLLVTSSIIIIIIKQCTKGTICENCNVLRLNHCYASRTQMLPFQQMQMQCRVFFVISGIRPICLK